MSAITPELTIQRVRGDLYVIGAKSFTPGNSVGNIAAYVTSDGVILVDSVFRRDYDSITAQLRTVTDKPVKFCSIPTSTTTLWTAM